MPVLLAMFAVVAWLETLAWPLWQSCLAIFVVAWIGQFIGHAIEGRRPSFFKDLQFLLIGPIWLLAFVYRSIGLRYSRPTGGCRRADAPRRARTATASSNAITCSSAVRRALEA